MKKHIKQSILSLPLFLIIFISCNKSNEYTSSYVPPTTPALTIEEQAQFDDSIINLYLYENNIIAIKDLSGIYYIITNEGNGEHPNSNSQVEVYYKGYLINGEPFDQTTNSSVEFNLSKLITGWQIGIPYLSKSGKGTFFIPSAYGYGANQAGSITPHSVLIFDIELINFK